MKIAWVVGIYHSNRFEIVVRKEIPWQKPLKNTNANSERPTNNKTIDTNTQQTPFSVAHGYVCEIYWNSNLFHSDARAA